MDSTPPPPIEASATVERPAAFVGMYLKFFSGRQVFALLFTNFEQCIVKPVLGKTPLGEGLLRTKNNSIIGDVFVLNKLT